MSFQLDDHRRVGNEVRYPVPGGWQAARAPTPPSKEQACRCRAFVSPPDIMSWWKAEVSIPTPLRVAHRVQNGLGSPAESLSLVEDGGIDPHALSGRALVSNQA